MWLHRPRARGVVKTTSMLLGWWMWLALDSMNGTGIIYYMSDQRKCYLAPPVITNPTSLSNITYLANYVATVCLFILLVNRAEADLAVGVASKSVGRYVCRPADLLATPTAKPASVRFMCQNNH